MMANLTREPPPPKKTKGKNSWRKRGRKKKTKKWGFLGTWKAKLAGKR